MPVGIPIHDYERSTLGCFASMVDAVGGVDITVRKALDDPRYPGLDGKRGWSVEPGQHHFNGADALAYARIRKSAGESDLTRAARQQQVLVALRNRAVGAGILFSLPSLLDAVGKTVRTDLPQDRLPQLAALAEQIGGGSRRRSSSARPDQVRRRDPVRVDLRAVPAKIRALVAVGPGRPARIRPGRCRHHRRTAAIRGLRGRPRPRRDLHPHPADVIVGGISPECVMVAEEAG